MEDSGRYFANLSVSLCYTAWDTARLDVSMQSENNRTEPVLAWSTEKETYTNPDISEMLKCVRGFQRNASQRGILTLSPRSSWVPDLPDFSGADTPPFVQEQASILVTASHAYEDYVLINPTLMLPMRPNSSLSEWSTYDNFLRAGYTISMLLKKFLADSDSPATALSSMITVVSSMAYYNQMDRFQYTSNTTQTYYMTVLFPRSHRGLLAFLIVLALHLLLVSSTVVAFVFPFPLLISG